MLTAEQINEIHRLHWAEHWSVRKIARHLHIGRRTIAKYITAPAQTAAPRQRTSKLDPFSLPSSSSSSRILMPVPR